MINFKLVPSPCYIVDEEKLRKNLTLIRKICIEADVEFILAFKGFASWKLFPVIKEYIKNTSASSLYEAKLAIEEMGTRAHTYAPAYRMDEFEEIIRYSSHISFNSLSQYNRFYPVIKRSGENISTGLRINPGYSPVKTALYNPASPGSRLGIQPEQLGEKLPEGIEGLHFHTLCESNSFDLEKTLEAFISRFEKYFSQIKWVNFGGGHLVSYKGYDVEHLIRLLKDFKNKYNLQVILEPGAAFVWQTGYLVSSVLDIVENGGIKTAILDVSFTAHMPDSLEMPYKPKIIGATDEIKGKPAYRLGGISCLAGDFIGNWSFENELKPGDQIIFEDMIHYTIVKTTMFNGVSHPSIGLWTTDNKFRLLRKFEYNDYKNRLS